MAKNIQLENYKLRIAELKLQLKKHKLDGYFVPMSDEFFCEYVPAESRRLEWLTGFTGSAGSCFIGLKNTVFETDGRYELQAQTEVGGHFDQVLINTGANTKNNILAWLGENFGNKSKIKIGFDPKLISKRQFERFAELAKNGIEFLPIKINLVDEIWVEKKSKKINTNITQAFALDVKFSGKSHTQKITDITQNLQADFCLLTLPESVCWLLNIRSTDLPHTPFLLSYALINKKDKTVNLYTDTKKINSELAKKLGKNVKVKSISEIEVDIKNIGKNIGKNKNSTIQTCPSNTNVYFYNLLEGSGAKIIHAADPCLLPKACKNNAELEAIRMAHIVDGAALVKFFYWLEKNVKTNKLTEINIAERLEETRKQNKSFFALSFDTIAGFGSNGAIIHYHANEKTSKKIGNNNLLLLDSGAQYLGTSNNKNICGTTDVTRTIAIGKPSAEQKRDFTLVLKGHIALANAKFVTGTSGAQLDILARMFLWAECKDYAHGTGHGVGHFLNVHEGPQGISRHNNTPLSEGMVISNEPGFYKVGEYGIRIENLIAVIPLKTSKPKSENYLQFETLTKAPIDLNLIELKLLDAQEKLWLNNYHAQVAKEIAPFLNAAEKKWLKAATRKI